MKNGKNIINMLSVFLLTIFAVFLIVQPEACSGGVAKGIIICGRIIIPSLFPFTVCVLFILKANIFKNTEWISLITKRLFGFSSQMFWIMVLSFIGGYPIGARLLNEAVSLKKITPKTAGVMLCYCVNAGPAFVVLAVGSGILGSKRIGYILLLSNILSALLLAFFSRKKFKIDNIATALNLHINPMDNFVASTAQAAATVMNICGFVVLFSGINQYITMLGEKLPNFKIMLYFLEVTNAVTNTNNIYFISFLLAFGGISVWCQVMSMAENIEINYCKFIIARIFHGALSCAITYLIVKIFKVTVPTISNFKSFDFGLIASTVSVSISMLVMSIVFIVSLSTKKYVGKILEDVV